MGKKQFFKTKNNPFSGTTYREVYKKAFQTYKAMKSKSKRSPYIKSKYFKKEKIFISIFWSHMNQKYLSDRKRRLRFYSCAIELLQNTTIKPEKIFEKTEKVFLYRFFGKTPQGSKFIVQVKENSKERKDFISCFPVD